MPETRIDPVDTMGHVRAQRGTWLLEGAAAVSYREAMSMGLNHEAALVAAQDGRYMHFVAVVGPFDWQIAANRPEMPLARIASRLKDMGYRPADLQRCLTAALRDEPEEEPEPVNEYRHPYTGRTAAEQAAMTRRDPNAEAVSANVSPAQPGRARREWQEARELPPARPDRHSQTPAGRHVRYVKARAAEWDVTERVADSRIKSHPPDCPYRGPR